MQSETFTIGIDRYATCWVVHGGSLLVLLAVGPSLIFNGETPSVYSFLFWTTFLSFIYLPHTLLFFNHLRSEKYTAITLNEDSIHIRKDGTVWNICLSDISAIEEYCASRSPWMIMAKWKIISRYADVEISSLIMPRSVMYRHFTSRITNKSSLYPGFHKVRS